MQGNLIDERDRIRKEARALVEELSRKRDERLMREATVSTFDWTARQIVSPARRQDFLRGSKDHGKEAKKDTDVYPSEIKRTGIQGLCIRLHPGIEYYPR